MTEDLKIIELRKKIAQAEWRLRASEAKLANYKKANAALQKFYAKGPHKKKKSGRPSIWKGSDGLFFVGEVEEIKKERKCKTLTAIYAVREETIRRAERAKAYGVKSPSPLIAWAATLAEQSHEELQVRYQEARRYWLFVIDPEAYQKEIEIIVARNPYDFS